MKMGMSLKHEKYLGALTRIYIFLYAVITLNPQNKIDAKAFRSESTNRKAWIYQHVPRVKDTISSLYDEFAALRDINIPAFTPTASPSPEVGMLKKRRWGESYGENLELQNTSNPKQANYGFSRMWRYMWMCWGSLISKLRCF